MKTLEEVIEIVKKARTFSLIINIITFMIGLTSLAVVVFASFGIFENPSNFQIFVLITAIIITLIMAWIAFSGIEKVGKLNNLLMKEDFLADVAKNTEDGVLKLWKDSGGEKIFIHMAEIRAPKVDQDGLYDSKNNIITAYMKIKTKARKALKNGLFTFWGMIDEIDEEYTTWLDETWESTLETIRFYMNAYEPVSNHDQIQKRLIELQAELYEEFRDSEDANYVRFADLDKILALLSIAPKTALGAKSHVDSIINFESIADEEIEEGLQNAEASGYSSGMVTAMMINNMTNSINNNN